MFTSENYKFNSELIKQRMAQNNLSISQLCNVCKISKYTYKKMMSGSLKINITAVYNICNTLHISSDSLVIKK